MYNPFYKYELDPDSDSQMAQAASRTIEEVFDMKEGVFIDADNFFSKPEGELFTWRRTLEESIKINKPRLVCSHCYQMVKLQGRYTSRGKIAFFSHLFDSDECDIKTNSEKLSREEILAIKYGMVVESQRHIRLKNLIATILKSKQSAEIGITNVEIEKRVNSKLPYLNWRRPDVMADYNGRKIVFELQLSTTFLGVVVDRDIFYRLNNYFIIWVFNFDDNQEYVNLSNMMCKDIYYANKRNVFILDNEAQEVSLKEGLLYFKCSWIDENGRFPKGKLISILDLKFDAENCKPYYFDADELYFSTHPGKKSELLAIEHTRQELVSGLMERMNKSFRMQNQSILLENRKNAIEEMKINGAIAGKFIGYGGWGFRYKDTIITPPYFDTATDVNEDEGVAYVTKNKLKGLVDKFGVSILPCQFKEIIKTTNGHYIVNQWGVLRLFGSGDSIRHATRSDHWQVRDMGADCCLVQLRYRNTSARDPNDLDVDILIFPDGRYHKIHYLDGLISENENITAEFCIPVRFGYSKIKFENKSKCEIDSQGNAYRKLEDGNTVFLSFEGYFGLNNEQSHLLVPPVFDYLDYSEVKDRYFVSSEGKMGLINSNNVTLIPCVYDCIYSSSINDLWIVQNDGMYGISNECGNLVLPVEFSSLPELRTFGDKELWYLEKNGLYGLADSDFALIVPCEFKEIESTKGDNIILQKENIFGLINNLGESILLVEYESLKETDNQYYIVNKNGLYGAADYCGKQTIPLLYKSVEFRNNCFVCYDDTKVYLSDISGNILFSAEGHMITNFTSMMIAVWPNTVYRYDGSVVCTFERFENVRIVESCVYVKQRDDSTDNLVSTCFNYKGEELPTKVEHIENTCYRIETFKDKQGLLDDNNNLLAPYAETNTIYFDKFSKSFVFENNMTKESIKIGEIFKPKDERIILGPVKIGSFLGKFGAYLDWRMPLLDFEFDEILAIGNLILYHQYFWIVSKYENNTLKRVTDEKYDTFIQLPKDMIIFRRHFGGDVLISTTGEVILPDIDRQYISKEFDANGHLKVLRKVNKYSPQEQMGYQSALLDENGKFACVYDADGYGILKVFDKYGIRKNGVDVFPLEYNEIIRTDDGCFILHRNNRAYLYSKQLEPVIDDEQVEKIKYVGQSYYSVWRNGISTLRLYNAEGIEIKLPIADVYNVRSLCNGGYVLSLNNNISAVCNSYFEIKFSQADISISDTLIDGKLQVKDRDHYDAYIDQGSNLLPSKEIAVDEHTFISTIFGICYVCKDGINMIGPYKRIDVIPGLGYSCFASINCNLNIYNFEGKRIAYVDADMIKPSNVNSSFFILSKWNFNTNYYGLLDNHGKTIIPCQYKYIQSFGTFWFAYNLEDFQRTKNGILYSSIENKKIKLKCCGIERFNNNIIRVKNQYGCVYYNSSCELLQYNLTKLNDKLFISEKWEKFGVVNEYGKIIVDNKYDGVRLTENDSIEVKSGSQWILPAFVNNNPYGGESNLISVEKDGCYEGVITGVKSFGLFIQVDGKNVGLLRKSHFSNDKTTSFYHVGDKIDVKVLDIRNDGKIDYDFASNVDDSSNNFTS